MNNEIKTTIKNKAYAKIREETKVPTITIEKEDIRILPKDYHWKYKYSCTFYGFGKRGIATVYFNDKLEVEYVSILYVDMDVWKEAKSVGVPIVLHTTREVAYFNEDMLKVFLKEVLFS